ncbi:MAG: hypothetical protein AAF996_04800 [Pseudomonadota bacterium]
MNRKLKKKNLHISFEALHVYAGEENFSQIVIDGAATAKRWLDALELVYQNASFAIVVFVDDYSTSGTDEIDRPSIIEEIREQFEQAGVVVDYIAFESDCAETCHYLRTDLVKSPELGEGAFLAPINDFQFDDLQSRLSFDYVSQDFDPDTEDARARGIDISAPEYRNDIGIGVSIGRETSIEGEKKIVWSCPAAASWWQLVRFGVLEDVDEPNKEGAPLGTWVRDHENRPAFVADKTISLLSPSYIAVEHAVRVILSNLVDLGPRVKKRIGRNFDDENIWSNRVNYIFHE